MISPSSVISARSCSSLGGLLELITQSTDDEMMCLNKLLFISISGESIVVSLYSRELLIDFTELDLIFKISELMELEKMSCRVEMQRDITVKEGLRNIKIKHNRIESTNELRHLGRIDYLISVITVQIIMCLTIIVFEFEQGDTRSKVQI